MTLFLCLLMQIEASTALAPEFKGKKLTVGDPFELVVTIKYPQSEKISEPFVDSIGPYAILGQKNRAVQEKGSVTSTYRMRLAAFETGDLPLPRFKFLKQDSAGGDTISSTEARITIASVLPEGMKDINDVKEQFEFPNILPFIIVGLVLAAGILVLAGIRIYRRLRRMRAAEKPQVPCWEEALAQLERLPAQDLLAKGLIKKYYYALSEILKRYLERRFEFPAIEQTTTEIVSSMRTRKTPLREDFGRFFDHADMVKYAKFIPPQKEIEGAALAVKDLVIRTKPAEASSGEAQK